MHREDRREHHTREPREPDADEGDRRHVGLERDAEGADHFRVLHAGPHDAAEGCPLQQEPERRRVAQDGWKNEFDRPVYFVELRTGYRCAWCQVDEGLLTLIPHPSSGVAVQSFNFPDDAEIVGQVAGIAMRLLPVEPSLEQ